jgi:very-short-patch-repair endonuclease
MPFDPDARLAEWRKTLLDTTKRNRLIKFVTGRIGGVNLLSPATGELWGKLVRDGTTLTFPWKRDLLGLPREVLDAETLAVDFNANTGNAADAVEVGRGLGEECLHSSRLRPTHILTDFPDRLLAARLTRLALTAKEAATDHGVTTLFAVFGFLRWYEHEDSPDELLSPLLLVPVRLGRETVESQFTLRAQEDDVLPNFCLAELLQSQFRIKLPTAAEFPLDPEKPECLSGYLAAVNEKVKHVRRWGVVESAALGVFNFQKLAMWEDLGRNAERVKAHPLCRAIAGDSAVSLKPPADLPNAADLDRVVSPETEVHILDADSSQHEAIEAVKRGAHLVMDGPPGTGKSQTIANMIAEALAAGKTVLFVSEKTAALEVVKRRLDACGIGDFCLELHSHKANKKEMAAELGRCLELEVTGTPDTSTRLKELGESRGKLNEFVAELHAPRTPLGWSAFRVHGELSRLDKVPGRSRLAIADVFGKDAEYVRRGAEILAGLADSRAVLEEPGGHPWRGCKLTAYSHAAADDAKFNLSRLANAVPAAERAAQALVEVGIRELPVTARSWRTADADAKAILDAPLFRPEWFTHDPRAAADSAIELDTASRHARELVGKLPEFDHAAVRKLANVADVAMTADRERLVATETLPARERLAVLSRVGPALRKLREQAGAIEKQARDPAGQLSLPALPVFGQLGEMAAIAQRLAGSPPIPTTWWETGRQAELLAAVARAAEDQRVSQTARTSLVAKFAPSALAPEASAPAREAAEAAASMWRWLPWSRWAKVRKQVEAWYPAGAGAGTAMRADMAELAAYHRRADAVQQVATAYARELFTDSAGKPDWAATAAGLNDVEKLGRWNPLPVFKSAVGPSGSLDRGKLQASAESLTQQFMALSDGWAAVLKEFAVADAVAALARPPAEVIAWLEAEAAAIEKEAATLGCLVELLLAGKEIAAGLLRERVSDVARLVESRSRIRAAAGLLGSSASPAILEATDHAAEAALATQLRGFLDRWARPITPLIAAAVTDTAARERVRSALKQSEAVRPEFDKAWTPITSELFDPAATVSTNVVLNDTTLADLGEWATARAADADRLSEWARFVQVENETEAFGIAGILAEVRAGEFPAIAAADAFRARFYRLWLDALHQKVPALAAFATYTHERLVSRFAQLDRLAVRTTPDRVRGQLLTTPGRPHSRDDAPDTSELGILLREVHKKQRHLPLRYLFRHIPSILPRLKPCLMMSPLAVSTYLDTPELTFDLVIFDEASQVRPHDAVCAIYRGRQLVVGGDPKQLPPTDFFNRSGEEADETATEEAGTGSFESLLDVCLSLGLTRKRLRWHYRSRREALIAFSNRFFYDGRLVTFPSADEAAGPAVTFVRVPEGRFKDGVNPIEAKRVAALVLEHARNTPDRSLGVIAFSQRQQDRILAELETLRRANTDTEPFFGDERADPFFVKNLENVQGDERDVIVLSVGYGPDEAGKVAMRFGPLNREGGERRLNVAITRARWSMAVVASMSASDIDLSRTGAEGAKMLKAFLDFAERGPAAVVAPITEANQRAADSPFEQEVGDELVRRGLTVHRQIGCGGYLVDMAITDSQRGGKYLLGVECDGATYHAAATARDRDRLRQAVLEGLGWRLIRVWSSDWVRDREKQVRRILAALEAAKKPKVEPKPDADTEKSPVVNWRQPKAKKEEYESIEVVPDAALVEAISGTLTEFGSMPPEELIAAVSKRLGFKRTGPKIRERLTEAVNGRVSAGVLGITDDGRVKKLPGRPTQ